MADTANSDLLTDNLDNFYKSPADEVSDDQAETEEANGEEHEAIADEVEDSESDTAETEDSEEEAGDEPGEFEVVIDGRAEKVTKAELVKGYQRQADYTRKTQALAEDRKAIESDRAMVSETLATLNAIGGDVEKLIMGDVSNIDWDDLRSNDPSEYLRMKEVVQRRQGALKEIVDRVKKLEADQTPKEQAALHKAMGWDHPDKGAQRRDADIAVLTEFYGNSPALAKAKDAETMSALIESAKYRKLMKEKASVKKELKQAPKVTKSAKSTAPASKNWLDSWYK